MALDAAPAADDSGYCSPFSIVIPAQAGIQNNRRSASGTAVYDWIPACAGMTMSR